MALLDRCTDFEPLVSCLQSNGGLSCPEVLLALLMTMPGCLDCDSCTTLLLIPVVCTQQTGQSQQNCVVFEPYLGPVAYVSNVSALQTPAWTQATTTKEAHQDPAYTQNHIIIPSSSPNLLFMAFPSSLNLDNCCCTVTQLSPSKDHAPGGLQLGYCRESLGPADRIQQIHNQNHNIVAGRLYLQQPTG